ncbi:hypothetical protein REPUB_Repub09cG0145100 [Reevesia pubescens]
MIGQTKNRYTRASPVFLLLQLIRLGRFLILGSGLLILGIEIKDTLIWKHNINGKYSSSTFCLSVLDELRSDSSYWNLVWAGLAPPKVEFFCWQLLKGRVVVKFNLSKRGLMSNSSFFVPCVIMKWKWLNIFSSSVMYLGWYGIIFCYYGIYHRSPGLIFCYYGIYHRSPGLIFCYYGIYHGSPT